MSCIKYKNMISNSNYLSSQTQYNNFVYVTEKRVLKTNSIWFKNIHDGPYLTSFIKHTQTQAFSST